MKQINVIVKNKNTLVLEEDASKGDYIELSSLSKIDLSMIEELFEDGKEKVYSQKLEESKKIIELENNTIVENLKKEIELLKKEEVTKLKEKEHEVEKIYLDKINELTQIISNYDANKSLELEKLNRENEKKFNEEMSKKDFQIEKFKNDLKTTQETFDSQIEIEKLKLTQKHIEETNSLKEQIDKINSEKELSLKNKDMELIKKLDEKKKTYLKQIEEKNEIIKKKQEEYDMLHRQKVSLNVKQTGEDLEAWCNNEVLGYMQNGMSNSKWYKDNEVVRDEDEVKGSKADYIFKVYANEECLDSELLTSICLDMKDENPDSVNKKSNADYYKQLDKNRIKKGCKYALLVSNLERDKPNDLIIYKVNEYKDMYVVRPAYLMTFLNMITSLTVRFKELLLADKKEKLELKKSMELMEEFENLKKTYLDKPLESLEKNVLEICKQNESIKAASNKITEYCDKITNNYIHEINSKLSNFEIKMNRKYKKEAKEN